jgi:flavodoxin
MKGVVVYDSVYGNTKMVAEAIAEQIRAEGHEAELVGLREGGKKEVSGDFLFIGSPTRMGKMTRRSSKFVKKMDHEMWKGKPIVAFDTILTLPEDEEERKKALKWTEYGAAPRLHDLAKERGLNARDPVLRVHVSGMKGPLVPTALEEAKKYTHDFLGTLKP